jgi:glucan phosphoethanolaminetransferase (alkaline phosphatase superfamily)
MIPSLSASGINTAIIILAAVIFYYIYYYFVTSGLPEKFCADINQTTQKEIALFLLKKFSGFLILGLIPGVLYYFFLNQNFEKFGLSPNQFYNNFPVILLLVITIVVILFINQKTNKQNNSLQIKLSEWNILLFLINATGWI